MEGSRRAAVASLLLALASLAGCASAGWLHRSKDHVPEASAQNPVSKIVCIWEPAEGQGVDGLPTRGFAGQILFFTRNQVSPVKVHGTARVYVYDDMGTLEEQAKPIHQFDFEGEAWNRHLQLSTLGPAYNVFIPYTRKHTKLVNCALRVRLTSTDGAAVYSDLVKVSLPGAARGVATAGAESSPAPGETPPLGASLQKQRVPALDAATLRLPDALAARAALARPRASQAPMDRSQAIAAPHAPALSSRLPSSYGHGQNVPQDNGVAQPASGASAGTVGPAMPAPADEVSPGQRYQLAPAEAR